MREKGHVSAARYPIGYLWNEMAWAERREQMRLETEMSLVYSATASAMSGSSHFSNHLKRIRRWR